MKLKNYRFTPQKRRALIILILVIIAAALYIYFFLLPELKWLMPDTDGLGEEQMTVFFLDVGQADAALIESPDGTFMMIDAGKNNGADKLVRTLSSYGVETIEYFVMTHPDEDHIGGADSVLENFEVKNIIRPDCDNETDTWQDVLDAIEKEKSEGANEIFAESGKSYSFFEGCDIEILSPIRIYSGSNNNNSVVLRLKYDEATFLFTGDAEKTAETAMLHEIPRDMLKADVLKVGHHGSYTATSITFLTAVDPDYAVISAGKDNDYGHPHAVVLDRLEAQDAQIFRTDEQGTITFYTDGKEIVSATMG